MSNNYRIYLLSVLLLINLTVTEIANAKASISNLNTNSTLENRVIQLERIWHAYSQLLNHVQQQIIDNKNDIDFLRGQIQENQYQLLKIIKQQKYISQQIDVIFHQIKDKSINIHSKELTGTNTIILRTIPAYIIKDNDTNAHHDYTTAVDMILKNKQYYSGIKAFQKFIKYYPNSIYQSNAYYWLGQLYYKQNKKDDAAYYFAKIIKKYPQSSSASHALLNVGIIMQEKNQKYEASTIYRQIKVLYPNSEVAKEAQKQLMKL